MIGRFFLGHRMDFIASKVLWALLDPANALVLALAAAFWLTGRRDPAPRRWGRRLVGLSAAFLLATATTPLSDLLAEPLEDRFPPPRVMPDDPAGIILLGGAVSPPLSRARGQPALNAAADRLAAFAELARRYPNARLISSGGSGLLLNQAEREDVATAAALAQMGVDPARVVFENQSRNTWENALLSRDLMKTETGGPWVLVTSAFHMPRSAGVFRKLGMEPIPYPVDYRTRGHGEPWLRAELSANLELLSTAAREWTGLAAYYLAGRLDEFFPAPR